MSSTCERGYVQFNPDINDSYDMEHDEEIHVPSNYPFTIPKIFIEGTREIYYPQTAFAWYDDSIIATSNNVLTKYTKHGYCELLAKDENGNIIWVDGRTAPYEGCWKGTYLDETRGVLELEIEELDLETFVKNKYKVSLDSTCPIEKNELFEYIDYIDPDIIKRFNANKDTNPS